MPAIATTIKPAVRRPARKLADRRSWVADRGYKADLTAVLKPQKCDRRPCATSVLWVPRDTSETPPRLVATVQRTIAVGHRPRIL